MILLKPFQVGLVHPHPFRVGSRGWGLLNHQNHAAGEKNSSIMVGMFVFLCLASQKPSEREFFVSAKTDLGVKLLMPNAHYPHLKNTFNFTREGLNRALSVKTGPFTGPNEFGPFLAKFQTECPYSGDKRRVTYFYRQVNGKPPKDPVCPLDINDELSKSNSLQRDCKHSHIRKLKT